MQAGFNFGEPRATSAVEMPPGTWEPVENCGFPTLSSVCAMAESVRSRMAFVPDSVRALFDAGVRQFESALMPLLAKDTVNAWDLHDLNDFDLGLGSSEVQAFKALCRHQSGVATHPDGVRWKTREQFDDKTFAICVDGVGCLMLGEYFPRHDPRVVYLPPSLIGPQPSDTFFLHSYADDAISVAMRHEVWGPGFAADRIANSDNGMATVSTFTYGGRDYIVTAGAYGYDGGKRYAIGTAWRLCPRSEWSGKTYSYRDHCRLLEDGIQERSDCRGIAVVVRGEVMVIESAMFVYDLNHQGHAYVSTPQSATGASACDSCLLDEAPAEEEAYA